MGSILNDIRSSDLDGSDKQFLTQLFAMRDRAANMQPGKVRALRQKMVKACGGVDGLNVIALLWLESSMGRKAIQFDGEGPIERLDIKRIASRAGIDKRDCHALLFLVAQSLPGFNGGSFGGVQ